MENGLAGTGTLMKNKISKECNTTGDQTIKKKGRGASEMENMSVDFITDLPDSKGINTILVAVNLFSKACCLVPMKGLSVADSSPVLPYPKELGQTEEFKVEVGLHQGSALSPFLFAMVMSQLSEEVRQESPWTMMFADDIVICSESREQVEENLERWRFALERRGKKVSRSKTEYMCVNEREGSGTVGFDEGKEVKKVQEFKYLGSTVQSNGKCGKEVKNYITTAIRLDNLLHQQRPGARPLFELRFRKEYRISREDGPEPMQLGRTCVSPKERQHRVHLQLCFYCRDSGHRVSACLEKPSSSKVGGIACVHA
ncbi:hypothetical protein QTP86_005907 [Hemibagrus guttatus]|nr:hypothetical protein QTP86_005907 [Hemibagrus guttatus]